MENRDAYETIKSNFPSAEIVGCSTSGEIGDCVDNETVSLTGMRFDSGKVKTYTMDLSSSDESRKCGQKLGQSIETDDLAGVFIISPGLNVNGSQLIAGLRETLPKSTTISGGLAGDGLGFHKTATLHNGNVSETQLIGLGIYGKNVKMHSASRGGWKPFGPLRRVTKAKENCLYELDGKPALDLYKEYLGDKAQDLPASGLLYPFAIMDENNLNAMGLIRTILNINEEEKSLILAGDLEVGQLVCLMHASSDELVAGAEEAARTALHENASNKNDAVICVSCVGRKILMGDDTEDELDAVKTVFSNSNICGFYSYGELGFSDLNNGSELHNQTMTITHITESAD